MRPATIFGPLISVTESTVHQRLFTEVFGMEQTEPVKLTEEWCIQLFGVRDTTATLTVLRTPGVHSGVVLCAFDPVSEVTVRTFDNRLDRDALKVVDFYAPDYPRAVALARAKGYRLEESQASYELAEGTFCEAHLWGPDNVVTAFLGGPASFFTQFAQVTDRLTSEVQSISAPVSDVAAVVAFYQAVFGWDTVYEYQITDHSFAELIGAGGELGLRAVNVGPSTREPYFGLIDYGLTQVGVSLRERAVPPARGLLGAVVLTDDLERSVGRAHEVCPGQRQLLGRETVELPHFGRVRAGVLHPPHGVLHLVLEAGR